MWWDPIVDISDDNVAKLECRRCGWTTELKLTPEQIHRLQEHDGLVQDILPKVKPEIRELFMLGLCDNCYRESLGLPTKG